jgi:hypothetical protein
MEGTMNDTMDLIGGPARAFAEGVKAAHEKSAPSPEPVGWMVCISMEQRETALGVVSFLEEKVGFHAHVRPIFRGADGMEVPGALWEPL